MQLKWKYKNKTKNKNYVNNYGINAKRRGENLTQGEEHERRNISSVQNKALLLLIWLDH